MKAGITGGCGREVSGIEDLADFIEQLASDLRSGAIPLSNSSVPSFLEALSGSLGDYRGRYLNAGINPDEVNAYQRIADAIDSATEYD